MNEIKLTNRVVSSNDLIQSVSKLDRTPLKLFEIALSCIDVNNPTPDNTVYLDKQQLFHCFQTESKDKYTRLWNHLKKLQQQNITVNLKNQRMASINITPYIEWGLQDDDNLIKIKFSEELMPYLIDLKKNFTQYQLKETLGLNSKHSIVLFKWLMMNYNQREYNYSKQHPSIKTKDLRVLTDTVNEYNKTSDFEIYVIKKSLKEINEKTSLHVTYKKIKKGRRIDNIQFFITEKNKQESLIEEGKITLDEFIEEVTFEDLLKEINSLFSGKEKYQSTAQDIMTLKFLVAQYGATKTRKAFVKCHLLEKYDDHKKIDLSAVENYLQHDKVELD